MLLIRISEVGLSNTILRILIRKWVFLPSNKWTWTLVVFICSVPLIWLWIYVWLFSFAHTLRENLRLLPWTVVSFMHVGIRIRVPYCLCELIFYFISKFRSGGFDFLSPRFRRPESSIKIFYHRNMKFVKVFLRFRLNSVSIVPETRIKSSRFCPVNKNLFDSALVDLRSIWDGSGRHIVRSHFLSLALFKFF